MDVPDAVHLQQSWDTDLEWGLHDDMNKSHLQLSPTTERNVEDDNVSMCLMESQFRWRSKPVKTTSTTRLGGVEARDDGREKGSGGGNLDAMVEKWLSHGIQHVSYNQEGEHEPALEEDVAPHESEHYHYDQPESPHNITKPRKIRKRLTPGKAERWIAKAGAQFKAQLRKGPPSGWPETLLECDLEVQDLEVNSDEPVRAAVHGSGIHGSKLEMLGRSVKSQEGNDG